MDDFAGTAGLLALRPLLVAALLVRGGSLLAQAPGPIPATIPAMGVNVRDYGASGTRAKPECPRASLLPTCRLPLSLEPTAVRRLAPRRRRGRWRRRPSPPPSRRGMPQGQVCAWIGSSPGARPRRPVTCPQEWCQLSCSTNSLVCLPPSWHPLVCWSSACLGQDGRWFLGCRQAVSVAPAPPTGGARRGSIRVLVRGYVPEGAVCQIADQRQLRDQVSRTRSSLGGGPGGHSGGKLFTAIRHVRLTTRLVAEPSATQSNASSSELRRPAPLAAEAGEAGCCHRS